MRFIDRSDVTSVNTEGKDYDVYSLIGDDGDRLTKEACAIAEEYKLGVLRLSHGRGYKIIKESGSGSQFDVTYQSLDEVDDALKALKELE